MSNILLINHYAGSPEMGMEFRPYYMAREWVRHGHRIDIVAADFSHLRQKNPFVTEDWEKIEIDGIYYHWLKTIRYNGNGAKRAFSMFQFVVKIWMQARKIAKNWKPDVIITSSTYPLDTFAGQRIRRFTKGRARLIHEVHDMWPITPMEISGMSKYHPFIQVLQYAENSFCRKADFIVSLLPNAKEYFMCHGMRENKFIHIPNGIVLEEWNKKEELPAIISQLLKSMKEKYKFLLCFFGSHTKSYALEYLIDAIKELDSKNIALVFVGDGIEKRNLMKRSEGISNICFLDPISKKYIPALLEMVDGVYIGALNNKMFRFGICMNKLFDSMMGGKPILYAVNAPNNYITQYQCGITVSTESVDSLVKGIRELLNKTESERHQMGENGKRAVIENFTYQVIAQQFERIWEN